MAELWAVSQNMATKIAARRGLEIIRQLVQSGGAADLAKANRLAMRPGVLKPSVAGSQVKDLGMGGEGLATMVADPKRGLSVRKLYDPQGIASEQMIRRKHTAGKNLVGEQSIAQYKGQAPTPQGGGTMQFSEFVPGNTANSFQAARTKQQAVQAISSRTPFNAPADIRAANMVAHPRTGKTKVIDFMPTAEGEIAHIPEGASHQIGLTPQGYSLINPNVRNFQIGNQKGLLSTDKRALEKQQSAHLKQVFLGKGPATTPAVTQEQQHAIVNRNLTNNMAKRRAMMPSKTQVHQGTAIEPMKPASLPKPQNGAATVLRKPKSNAPASLTA